jgi:hypothetical protein
VPDIVYVDNNPDSFTHLIPGLEENRVGTFVYSEEYPAEDALEPAKEAKVWLFDFFLVEPAHAQSKDENGLSLFQKWQAAVVEGRPTTVLISSALESAIKEPLGPVERHHVIAQRRGVEWIGDKSIETWRRVVQLADGAAVISDALKPAQEEGKPLGTYDLEQLCYGVLQVPKDAAWGNSAQRQVDRARPPREVPLLPPATARALLGWLISHVLPYPSFLLTDAQAALRLQITPVSYRALAGAIEGEGDRTSHRTLLAASCYKGPLANFLGRRWWRAGIDDLAWQLSQEPDGYDPALERLGGAAGLEKLLQPEPVLVADADLVETDEVSDASECVRVTDEDFPANVEPAWVRIVDLQDNRELKAKVIYEDRDLLEESAP